MSEQPEKFDLRSHDITEDKQADLLRMFPEIGTEGGKVDFEPLKFALGGSVDIQCGSKRGSSLRVPKIPNGAGR